MNIIKLKQKGFYLKLLVAYLILISTILQAEVRLSKELLENDIETNEYQLFVTNTMDMPIDGLEAEVAFSGDLEKYLKLYREKYEQDIKEDLDIIAKSTGKIVFRSFFGGLLFGDNSNVFFGDSNYVQVTDYKKDGEFVTRIIKYIVSDENLPQEDQDIIYATTNRESYHFNEGQIRLIFSTDQQLKDFNKGLK